MIPQLQDGVLLMEAKRISVFLISFPALNWANLTNAQCRNTKEF